MTCVLCLMFTMAVVFRGLQFLYCVSHSVVSDSWWPHGCSRPGSSGMEFSRQGYWCGLPFPSSGDLPDPWIKPGSLALQAVSLPAEPPGKPTIPLVSCLLSWGLWASLRNHPQIEVSFRYFSCKILLYWIHIHTLARYMEKAFSNLIIKS